MRRLRVASRCRAVSIQYGLVVRAKGERREEEKRRVKPKPKPKPRPKPSPPTEKPSPTPQPQPKPSPPITAPPGVTGRLLWEGWVRKGQESALLSGVTANIVDARWMCIWTSDKGWHWAPMVDVKVTSPTGASAMFYNMEPVVDTEGNARVTVHVYLVPAARYKWVGGTQYQWYRLVVRTTPEPHPPTGVMHRAITVTAKLPPKPTEKCE